MAFDPPAPAGSGPLQSHDELKPVTALFADVVGSTQLGERLRPDEVISVIGRCVSLMARAVEEYGGVVQAYMGDGICAYFGVPVTNEDDPERAALAALRITESLKELAKTAAAEWNVADLDVRVGINTGQTAVGFVGASDPKAVALGDATNTAARIQSAAIPGQIWLGETTAELLQEGFVVESAGEVSLKGKAEPVPVWQLVSRRVDDTVEEPIPLIGRDAELQTTSELLEGVRAGRGAILLISGDRGIGKTRLLREIRLLAADVAVLSAHCPSYGTRVAFGPFVQMLQRWIGLGGVDDASGIRTKLRARLENHTPDIADEIIQPLAALVGAPFDETNDVGFEDVLLKWLEALAATAPLAITIDDLHWADPGSHDLLRKIALATDRAPIMIVATSRLDVDSPARAFRGEMLSELSHRTTDMPLRPLTEETARRLADAIASDVALDEEATAAIVRLSEGNPLYLEELVRALIEGGDLVRDRSWTLVDGGGVLPPALESLLVARVDRLPEGARRLAQLAAVLGREFSVDVLTNVAGVPDVSDDLAVLLRAGIVSEVARYPRLECAFKHGLVHEAALSTLTPPRRRALYAEVARAHETIYADTIDDHVEELAFYYYRSDDLERAQAFLDRAARRVEGRGGITEAAPFLRRLAKVAESRGDDGAASAARSRLTDAGLPLEESLMTELAESEPAADGSPPSGDLEIAGFRLGPPIGEGATGVVYRATTSDGRDAAVKILRQELSGDDVFRKRFEHEARAAGEVKNDHLVELLGSGESEGRYYLAMAFIPGSTLKDLLEDGPMEPIAAARVIRQIASALDSLHEAGIVHRDLKPANVIVDDKARATLTDLGLAKGRAYTVLTRPGQVLGTLDYMAPEVIKGEVAGPASDVYSLACIAFECLTGKAPFADLPVLEVGLAHLKKDPPDAAEVLPSVPKDAGWTVLQAMSKDPERRPPSAGAFANLLRVAVGR